MTKTKKWSNKYKKSINCKKPKGFSQKQYCKYGRKKTMKGGGRGDKELQVIKIGSERYEYKVVDMDKIIVFNNKKKINEDKFRDKFRKHENEFRKQLPENIKHLNIEIKLTDKKTSKQPPVIDKHKPEVSVMPPSFSKKEPTFNDIINELKEKNRKEKEKKIGYSRLSTLPKQSNKSKTPDKSNTSDKSNKSNTSDKSNKSNTSDEFKKKQISETSSFSELGDSSSSK